MQAAKVTTVEVNADDTDIAVMLLYHWNDRLNEVIFHSTKKSWSIKESSTLLSPGLKSSLLLLHAFSGCDTTSEVFGLGKNTAYKKFKGN